ncbi:UROPORPHYRINOGEN-III SYNTHASE / Uroporphyrin-III C-methyltransferase (fragment) [Burkholderiales bacterium 8X]
MAGRACPQPFARTRPHGRVARHDHPWRPDPRSLAEQGRWQGTLRQGTRAGARRRASGHRGAFAEGCADGSSGRLHAGLCARTRRSARCPGVAALFIIGRIATGRRGGHFEPSPRGAAQGLASRPSHRAAARQPRYAASQARRRPVRRDCARRCRVEAARARAPHPACLRRGPDAACRRPGCARHRDPCGSPRAERLAGAARKPEGRARHRRRAGGQPGHGRELFDAARRACPLAALGRPAHRRGLGRPGASRRPGAGACAGRAGRSGGHGRRALLGRSRGVALAPLRRQLRCRWPVPGCW